MFMSNLIPLNPNHLTIVKHDNEGTETSRKTGKYTIIYNMDANPNKMILAICNFFRRMFGFSQIINATAIAQDKEWQKGEKPSKVSIWILDENPQAVSSIKTSSSMESLDSIGTEPKELENTPPSSPVNKEEAQDFNPYSEALKPLLAQQAAIKAVAAAEAGIRLNAILNAEHAGSEFDINQLLRTHAPKVKSPQVETKKPLLSVDFNPFEMTDDQYYTQTSPGIAERLAFRR
jgi:hypothetical protein